MPEDHLSNELSVGVDLTPNSVSANAKSRFLSSIDRLLGGILDLATAPIEGLAERTRARSAEDIKFIAAAGAARLKQLDNSEYAERAIEQQLKTALHRHDNKVQVVTLAIEDLRNDPPTMEENESGSENLSDDFLNRFERYAEDASSDELRERWGRVLASEIRAPGTFSPKVMRIVDELDATTAAAFEKICQHRVGNVLISCLVGDIDFMELTRLVTAGLVVDPGFGGQVRLASDAKTGTGEDLFMLLLGKAGGIAIPKTEKLPPQQLSPKTQALVETDGKPSIPVYILTDEGHAISSILTHDEKQVALEYIRALAESEKNIEFREYWPILGKSGSLGQGQVWNKHMPSDVDAQAG